MLCWRVNDITDITDSPISSTTIESLTTVTKKSKHFHKTDFSFFSSPTNNFSCCFQNTFFQRSKKIIFSSLLACLVALKLFLFSSIFSILLNCFFEGPESRRVFCYSYSPCVNWGQNKREGLFS